MRASSPADRANRSALPSLIAHLIALCAFSLLLSLAGQPLFTEDVWIHLALGEAFASGGPWLAEDPALFTAPGPPPPAAWLAELFFLGVAKATGFQGLRALHVLLVGIIGALVWQRVRQAGNSRFWASVGLTLFVYAATYRVAQLRPHLFTMLAALLLYGILAREAERHPLWIRAMAAAVLGALWSNFHAAFLLGPILALGSAVSVAAVALYPEPASPRPIEIRRAGRLLVIALAMCAGTLANPLGLKSHLVYFAAGKDTPDLSVVVDEWGPVDLFSWPVANLPPSWMAWAVSWLLACALGTAVWILVRRWWTADRVRPLEPDPVLVAFSVASFLALLSATRFLWLAVFPLALAAALLQTDSASRGRVGSRCVVVVALAASLPGFWFFGDWPMLSKALTGPDVNYREAYPAAKYQGHTVWFLADSGLAGRAYNDYRLGGFMSYWLAPTLKLSTSGTLNIDRESMERVLALKVRLGQAEDESFLELLDRIGVDVFVGDGLPEVERQSRPLIDTTRHLEGAEEWILVYRNVRGAVYLRRGPRGDENLARVEHYYATRKIPFDRERGFDVERVIAAAPDWARDNGIIPSDFAQLLEEPRGGSARILHQRNRLASLFATLGLYDRALELDRETRWPQGAEEYVARRKLWLLLRSGQTDAAERLARQIVKRGVRDPFVASLAQMVLGTRDLEPAQRDALRVRAPLIRRSERGLIMQGFVLPAARPPRSN